MASMKTEIPPVICKTKALKLLNAMHLTRFVDEKMNKLVRQNKGGTFHLSVQGHEMVGALAALHLKPRFDWGLPYYRDRAFAIGLGCPIEEILGAFLARAVPHHSGGRMMPEHFSHKSLRIPVQSSVVGSQFLHAVGVALGAKLRGEEEVVYVSAGDGATSQGDFHEALNFSCLHQLPVLFVIQDNGWAISVPVKEQTAGACHFFKSAHVGGPRRLHVHGQSPVFFFYFCKKPSNKIGDVFLREVFVQHKKIVVSFDVRHHPVFATVFDKKRRSLQFSFLVKSVDGYTSFVLFRQKLYVMRRLEYRPVYAVCPKFSILNPEFLVRARV